MDDVSFGMRLGSVIPGKGPVIKTQKQGKTEKICDFVGTLENIPPDGNTQYSAA